MLGNRLGHTKGIFETINLTDLEDVTITGGVQYDHLELNAALEWVNVDKITVAPSGTDAIIIESGKRLVFDGEV